jgi:hypothetical protein
MEWEHGGVKGAIFAARTNLDATGDSSGPERLSGEGLHRTEAESGKRGAVQESAAGAALKARFGIGRGMEASLGLAGYQARYSPALESESEARDRFPLAGDGAGAVGVGGDLSVGKTLVGTEVGFDQDGQTAWRINWIQGKAGRGVGLRGAAYYFPARWHSPRGGGLPGADDPRNRYGAAMMVYGRAARGIIRNYQGHIEVERRPWRSWTIPTASTSSRASMELGLPISGGTDLTIRYRRRFGVDGSGEEAPAEEFTEDRLRLTFRGAGTHPKRGWIRRA